MDWIEVFGIIVSALIAIILGVPPLRAALEDLRRKPQLSVSLSFATERRVVYVADIPQRDFLLAEFQIEIANEGGASATGVVVRLDVPSNLYITDGIEREPSATTKILKYESAADPVDGTLRTLVTYLVPVAQQGAAHLLVDAFTFKSNSTRFQTVHATTKDDVPVEVELVMRHSYRAKIEVVAENHPPITAQYEIEFYRPDSSALRNVHGGPDVGKLVPRGTDGAPLGGSSAQIFFLNHKHLLFENTSFRIWQSKLAGSQVQIGTYFKSTGYLPIKTAFFDDDESYTSDDSVYLPAFGAFVSPMVKSIKRQTERSREELDSSDEDP
jgi:hypothetical protein